MQIRRLRLTNFRQHEATDLTFDRGLIGIVGPNGSGKSTLLEAISFALYGVSSTRGTRDTLRRRGASPRARFEVELEFTLGAHRYTITRGLTQAWLAQDGEQIANSGTAVTSRVTALLGMTREEFFNTYFTGQKELAVMAAMSRPERAHFLSRVIGYDRLRVAQEALRTDRARRKAERGGIEQGLIDPAVIEAELEESTARVEAARAARVTALAQEEEIRASQAALVPTWTAAQQRRDAWQSLDGEKRLVDKRVAVAREQFHTLDQQLAQALQAAERIQALQPIVAEFDRLAAERDLLDVASAAFAARSHAAARRDQVELRLREVAAQVAALGPEAALEALESARGALRGTREQVDLRLNEQRMRWTENRQEATTRRDALRERYREIKEQRDRIESQGPEGICPTCGRPLGKDFRSMIALFERQMEEVETDGRYFSSRLLQLGDRPAALAELEAEQQRIDVETRHVTEAIALANAQRSQRRDLEAERIRLAEEHQQLDRDLTGPAGAYDAARHDQVRNRMAELEPSRREFDRAVGIARRAQQLGGEVATAEQRATQAEAELAAINQRLEALGWDPALFALLEAAVREAELASQQAQFAVRATADQLDQAQRARDAGLARRADRASKAEAARALGVEITLLDELDRAFTDLRSELNLQLRPELADRASTLLGDLSGGRYTDLELDEDYVPVVVDDGEAQPVISGGEEDSVNLALRLAISQLIAERAGQPLSLLVLDEIFGSLDEERRNLAVALLRALSNRFPQVIVISHVDGMRDAFDRLLRVSYDVQRGVSTVSEDLPEMADVAL